MRVHIQSEEILTAAFAALNNIAVDIRTREVASAPDAVFEIVVLAMKKFPNSEFLQKNACFLLRSYSYSVENLSMMRNRTEDFMKVLPVASENFPDKCRDKVVAIVKSLYS